MTPERVVVPIGEWDRPPGVLLVGILSVLLLVILESASRLAEVLPMLAWMAVAVIGLVWLLRLASALRQPGERRGGSWIRWLLVPALVGATLVLVEFDVPFGVRLELGRSAMTAEAQAALADPESLPTAFGLFPAESVDVGAGDLSFIIGGSGFFDSVALTYSPDGPPDDPYEAASEFRDLGGGWWRWTVEF